MDGIAVNSGIDTVNDGFDCGYAARHGDMEGRGVIIAPLPIPVRHPGVIGNGIGGPLVCEGDEGRRLLIPQQILV